MITNKKLVEISVVFILTLLLFMLDHSGVFFLFFSVLLSIYLLILYRNNVFCVVIALIFILSNCSFFYSSFVNTPQIMDYSFDLGLNYLLLSSKIVYVFNASLVVFSSFSKHIRTKTNRIVRLHNGIINNAANPIIVVALNLLCIAIWLLFYNFSLGSRAGYSPIYEYSIILFIFSLFYSKKNKALLVITLSTMFFYVVFDFLGGQRSTGFQLIIIAVLFLFREKLNLKKILVFGFFGLIAANILSAYRQNFTFSLSIVFDQFKTSLQSGFTSDTASFAYYTSNVFLYARSNFSSLELLGQFKDFMLSQVVVGTVGESITTIASRFHYHFFGGVLPIYFYYYLGYFGTIGVAGLLSLYFKKMNDVNTKTSYSFVFSIYITASCLRWFLYSPMPLIRGVLLLTIVFFVLKVFDNTVFSHNNSQRTLLTD